MTRTGEVRRQYRTIEQAPSRFSPAYRDWADRADAWGKHLALALAMPEEVAHG